MKRVIPLLILTLLLGLSLACEATAIFDEETPTPRAVRTTKPRPTRTPKEPTATPRPTNTPKENCPNGTCIVACVNKLDEIVEPKKPPRHKFDGEEEFTLVTYDVDGNEISNPEKEKVISSLKSYQNDTERQQKIWEYFAAIIPLEQRTFITHYLVFTDGESNVLASVAQSYDSASQWDLSVDILDTSDPKDLTFTLVHEFGHLLTLNPDQVKPSKAIFDNPDSDSVYNKEKKACSTYFPGEGCSNKDSYINLFFKRFWPSKLYTEWEKIDATEDEDELNDKIDRFYKKYKDQFVSDYAPTSPAEDIAESWSFFILKRKPANKTIANQKVLFFYDFPELLKLREQIAQNLCNQLEK